MTIKKIGGVLLCLLLAGCGPSEEAFKAAQQEIATLKMELAEARRKLAAADSETRNRIFSLGRQINRELRASPLDEARLRTLSEELGNQLSRMHSLGDSAIGDDESAATTLARYYDLYLNQILELGERARRAYQGYYQECVKELAARETDETETLGTQLCEVEAEAESREPRWRFEANLEAVSELGRQMTRQRQNAERSLEDLKKQVKEEVARLIRQRAG